MRMVSRPQSSAAKPTVGEQLGVARQRRFVGRRAEIELFREAIDAAPPEFALLFIHGPGGIGKTALLEAFADVARTGGVAPTRVDLRAVQPSPAGFISAVAQALELEGTADLERLFADGERRALLLDTYETVAGLDGWLRQSFLPALPTDYVVVIAGRKAPDEGWSIDLGWSDVLQVLPLRNLGRAEAQAFLEGAGVPAEMHEQAVKLTHGHPLALALVVDVLAQADPETAKEPLDLAEAPDILPPLVQRFAAGAPSSRHKEALQVAARAQFTTEALLRSALQEDDAQELFAWLRGLSFVEQGRHGLFPHDLARDVIEADLRWRDQDSFVDLHRRVRSHLIERIAMSEGPALRQAVTETVFLHRTNPLVSAYWDWDTFGQVYADELRRGDRQVLLEMVEKHEGTESAAIAERWMERQPGSFAVARMGGESALGFVAHIALHEAEEADLAADPGALSMWEYAQRYSPPRFDEEVFAARFLVDGKAHQGPSPTQNLATVIQPYHAISRPRLSWDFIGLFVEADAMEPLMAYIDYQRVEEADFEIGGVHHGVFAHDWRRSGIEQWLDLMAERETGLAFDPNARSASTAPPLALSKTEFAESVREGLRELHHAEALGANPLMRSRALRDRAGEQPSPEDLCDLLEEAVDTLRADPRDEKFLRALARTYVRPARTQELAAEALGLPFSTYRRHLTRGLERVVEWLWQRELYGPES